MENIGPKNVCGSLIFSKNQGLIGARHLKLCVFTENHYRGGLDTFLFSLFADWPDVRDDLTLICNDSHPGLADIKSKVGQKVRVRTYRLFFNLQRLSKKLDQGNYFDKKLNVFLKCFGLLSVYFFLFPFYVLNLVIIFRSDAYEKLLVVNGGYPASILCRAAILAWCLSGKKNKPVLSFHSAATISKWYLWLPDFILDWMVVNCIHAVISVSQNALASLSNRPLFNRDVRKSYIYNGIADPIVGPITCDRFRISDETYCLMLSTFHEYKGHTFLFDVFSQVVAEFPEVKLVVCGDGTESQKDIILNKIKSSGLQKNVIVMGFVSDPYELINNAVMILVPSQAFEAFGLTIVESMAFSKPFVCTDVGGIPEVIDDSNAGLMFDRNDVAGFAAAIQLLLRDNKLAVAFGKKGRATFLKRYQAKFMAAKYRDFMNY